MLETDLTVKRGKLNITSDFLSLNNHRELHSGDDYKFNFTLVDADGTVEDITGATFYFTVKYDVTDSDANAVVKIVGALVDGPSGTFSVTIANTDVAGPAFINADYDIQMIIAANQETILYGAIEFLAQYTTV